MNDDIFSYLNALNPPHLYIHLPFCKYKCAYCAFYSVSYGMNLEKKRDLFFKKLLSETDVITSFFKKRLPTVYIGGGTPNLSYNFEYLLNLLDKFKHCSELSVECNISFLDENQIKELSKRVTRLSCGIQSFDKCERDFLCRFDNIDNIYKLMEFRSHESDFPSLNFDFITSFNRRDTFSPSFDEFVKYTHENSFSLPEHISLYMLSVDEGSVFKNLLLKRSRIMPSDDECAEVLTSGWKTLKKHGYEHYEISSFARNNKVCEHNYSYWQMKNYFSLGPSGASRIYNDDYNYSMYYPSDLDFYISQPLFSGYKIEKLKKMDVAIEMIAMGLRTKRGVDVHLFKKRTGIDVVKILKDSKLKINYDDEKIFLDEDDFIYADYYTRELICKL